MHSASWNNINELVCAFRKGDKQAFEQIYHQCNRSMFLAAIRIIKDRSEAEGIVNEVFIKFWEKRENFTGADNLESYLVRMTSNLARDYYRKSKRHGMAEEEVSYLAEKEEDPVRDEAEAEALIIKAKLANNVLKEMDQMPERMKAIFKMFFVQELTSTEISKRLNISIDTVRVQKSRAVHLLKNIFGWKDLPEE